MGDALSIVESSQWSSGTERPFIEVLRRFAENPPRWNYFWMMSGKSYDELQSGVVSLEDLIAAGRAWPEWYLESAPSASSAEPE